MEAAEGLSRDELCESIRSPEIEIQHDGYSPSDFCDALINFDDAFIYDAEGEDIYPEE